MTSPDSASLPDTLRWRIPEGRLRVSLRFALLRIALATVAVGFLVLFLMPAEVHSGLMTAAIIIALILTAIELLRAWREASGPANVWLDAAGVHWLDARGQEQSL